MPYTRTRYLQLKPDIGLAPAWIRTKDDLEVPNPRAGEPDAINVINVQVPVPTMVGNDVIDVVKPVSILPAEQLDELTRARIIPGTRVIETTHPAVAGLLLECGQYDEVDAPAELAPRKPKTTEKGA